MQAFPLVSCLSLCVLLCTCSASTTTAPLPILTNFPIEVPPVDPRDFGVKMTPAEGVPYPTIKNKILQLRERLRQDNLSLAEQREHFTKALVNDIIPYWYNTAWSFEGYTATPGQNYVACGYFVSTTLRHLGLELNRYRLAQQAPALEAKTLALGQPVLKITTPSVKENIVAIQQALPEGIHFIGFGTGHVGFVLKVEDALFLIHSNWVRGYVCIEDIRHSEVFAAFDDFYLVPLSTNEELLKKWLNGDEIEVLTE